MIQQWTCAAFRHSPAAPQSNFKPFPEIVRLAVKIYLCFPLLLRNVEDMLHVHGIDVGQKTVRYWWHQFGLVIASGIQRKRGQQLRANSRWKWHVDEVAKITASGNTYGERRSRG